jgi:hypothetical protein
VFETYAGARHRCNRQREERGHGRADDTGDEARGGDGPRNGGARRGRKVSRLVEDDDLKEALAEIRDDAAETEERCTKLAESLDGKKTTILEKARETRPPGKDRCSSPPRKIRTRSRASSSPSAGWADRLRARRSP